MAEELAERNYRNCIIELCPVSFKSSSFTSFYSKTIYIQVNIKHYLCIHKRLRAKQRKKKVRHASSKKTQPNRISSGIFNSAHVFRLDLLRLPVVSSLEREKNCFADFSNSKLFKNSNEKEREKKQMHKGLSRSGDLNFFSAILTKK